jgi:hypothetical protein
MTQSSKWIGALKVCDSLRSSFQKMSLALAKFNGDYPHASVVRRFRGERNRCTVCDVRALDLRGKAVRRLIAVLIVSLLPVLGVVSPASAVKPSRGCPDGFQLKSLQAAAQDLVDNGSPYTVDELVPRLAAYDKNGDGALCMKHGPVTPGLPSYTANFVDNTANA